MVLRWCSDVSQRTGFCPAVAARSGEYARRAHTVNPSTAQTCWYAPAQNDAGPD
jgi:hypothetical protein